jgi:hypothetical protein
MDDGARPVVAVPVPPEVAERWPTLSESEKERIGRLVAMVVSEDPVDRFERALDTLHRRVREAGLSEDEVDAELADWNAERRR